MRNAFVDALLTAGESLCRRGEYAVAARLFDSLESADSERERAAAFRGLLFARPGERLTMIVAALGDEQPWKHAVAADYLRQLTQAEDIAAIAHAVADLPTDAQVSVLLSLRRRGHPSIRAAALQVLEQADVEAQAVALGAANRVGSGRRCASAGQHGRDRPRSFRA